MTHYQGGQYLSMVNCRPEQMAIWKDIRKEAVTETVEVLNVIFLERIQLDNQ